MKPDKVRSILDKRINEAVSKRYDYCVDGTKNFVRNRKLPLKKMVTGIIGMGAGNLSNEVLKLTNYSTDGATTSAFIQQRAKIKPTLFENIFRDFSKDILDVKNDSLIHLAVDGTGIQIPINPNDTDSYFPANGIHRPYNLLHMNALYSLNHHIYVDAVIQKRRLENEHKALVDMVDRSTIPKALVIADRGYESYNNMAHIQEKGWYFLIRIRDQAKKSMKSGFDLPDTDEYDINLDLKITRKHTNQAKELCKDRNQYKWISHTTPFDYLPVKTKKKEPLLTYTLKFRIVRLEISEDSYELVLTNLDKDEYPINQIKKLYASRWGIETSFRDLKYSLGMLNFHTKKVMCIYQEIYSHLIMYNFAEMITSHVVIKQKKRKYIYKANFTVAAHVSRMFYARKITSPVVEALIAKNITPIRPNRKRKREWVPKTFVSFLYRVA